jgi:hypothetical protein
MRLREAGCEVMSWIRVSLAGFYSRALVNTVSNLGREEVLKAAEIYVISYTTVKVTTITVYAREDASLLRNISVQLRTIFRHYTCDLYENYYTYNGSVVLGLIFFFFS